MADILIRGMKMPTQCGNCPISTNTRRCTILWREFGNPSKRLEDCPLIPLPEGHGKLGDLDSLYQALMRHEFTMSAWDMLEVIANAETIVPAEGGNADGV